MSNDDWRYRPHDHLRRKEPWDGYLCIYKEEVGVYSIPTEHDPRANYVQRRILLPYNDVDKHGWMPRCKFDTE